jgi:signal transduction histidine kinase
MQERRSYQLSNNFKLFLKAFLTAHKNNKISNIDELKKNINISALTIFLIIFSLTGSGLYLIHNLYLSEKSTSDSQNIVDTMDLYKSTLSEKMSIVSSSTIFLDYLRSGPKTRENINYLFVSGISLLKTNSISGMRITDKKDNKIYENGKETSENVTVELCYLGDTLNKKLGNCEFEWTLFFNKNALVKELISLNPKIQICEKCADTNLINGNTFSSFSIARKTEIDLPLIVTDSSNNFFYTYMMLLIISFAIFGTWSWYRLSSLLNNYIASPIKTLTSHLKSNEPLALTNNLDEIQYLIDEINIWKSKVSKIQADESAAKIARIVAEMAHDIRSPLAAINMLVQFLPTIPEEQRVILNSATQRISDIANSFLSQYKNPTDAQNAATITQVHMASLLTSIVAEKRSQYGNKIELNLSIAANSLNAFTLIVANDFKRVISNLINNAVESKMEKSNIHINLDTDNDNLKIDITDNGCGIPAELLPEIRKGGLSVGKSNGNGLGLSHAISVVESYAGGLHIESEIGRGTTVSIDLPKALLAPNWFQSTLVIPDHAIICILDNELYAHEMWKLRFEQFPELANNIRHCHAASELSDLILENHTQTVFLIDYDLGSNCLNGLDVILKYTIMNQSSLVTNRYDDAEIQKRCLAMGVKIIPKNHILHLDIIALNNL